MEDAVTCEICSERFSPGRHDPLVLPCGHTFCRTCLTHLKEKEDFICPSCRNVQDTINVNNLPVNYKLLSLSTDNSELKYEICSTHGDELTYWCRGCQLSLCSLCVFRNHPQGHEVVKMKLFLQEKKRLLEQEIQKWPSDITTHNKEKIQKIVRELKGLFCSEAQLLKSKEIISGVLSEIRSASSLKTIISIETKIKNLKSGDEVVEKEHNLSECKGLANEEVSHKIDTTQSQKGNQPKKSYCCIQNNDGSKAEIEWQNGNLLISSFSEKPSDCDLLLKMPSEVFLELSFKDKFLGQVIIQPWYHLRRAQQFAALCLGTFGVSYLGSSFTAVENKNCTRECLTGGWYLNPHDGTLTCQDLMTDLEWGGEITGEAREGVVLGCQFSTGETGFAICTRGKKGSTFVCPFGKVVSGMNVVKAAVRHEPVTEVTITRCGVIVPNFFT